MLAPFLQFLGFCGSTPSLSLACLDQNTVSLEELWDVEAPAQGLWPLSKRRSASDHFPSVLARLPNWHNMTGSESR